MAAARWAKHRERQARLADLPIEQRRDRIVRRIVVIDDEQDVREVVIYANDSRQTARQKRQRVLTQPDPTHLPA